jgi:hypothetical protein
MAENEKLHRQMDELSQSLSMPQVFLQSVHRKIHLEMS